MFGKNIKVETELLARCKEQAKKAGYSSVEEFITHTLEKELKKSAEKPQEGTDEVANRLRGLGYLE